MSEKKNSTGEVMCIT